MVSNLTAANQQFLNNVSTETERLNRTELEIASGTRMRDVSDKPDQVSALLQMRAGLAACQQISDNLVNVKTEVDTGEQTLESAVQLFDQVQTLAAQGATGTQPADARRTLAQQLQSMLQEFVGFANTSIQGRYIFSGDTDQTAAYIYDATQANPVSAYQGATSTRDALHPNGTTFPIALTAQQIFDSATPADNVFASIQGLIVALNNNDEAAIRVSNAGLKEVAEYLNQQLGFYGSAQNKIATASEFAQSLETQLQSQIGNLQDTDTASAILELTETQTQLQAAFTSQAQIPRRTLFDYLG
jgi:flagellar hook-associated protein 3 FlgL